ncbi:hypothetical protein FRC11_012099, partial [Ceratobasidium sp. 423]
WMRRPANPHLVLCPIPEAFLFLTLPFVTELSTAIWVVTIKYLTPTTAERLFPEELEKYNAIEGVYDSLEPNETMKYLFKNALQFASIIAEALPGSTVKTSFLVYMKAWELLEQQPQIDEIVQAILRSLTRIRDIVDTAIQASSSMLPTALNLSKEPIDKILALLEDVSVYIFNRYTTNCLARIPHDDSPPDDVFNVEAYLARIEDLQTAFYASWSSAATSGMDLTSRSTINDASLEPSQTEQITLDESTRRADSYEIRSQLRPMDPSGYDPDQACLNGTREAVLNKIITWSQNCDNGESFLWISGPAGMGKTSVATSLCQRLHNIRALAGSFFCQRGDPDSSDPLR